MRTVNVTELRGQRSSIARVLPVQDQIEIEDVSLVASGQMTLPKKTLHHDRFWSIGGRARQSRKLKQAIQRALDAEREELYAGLLGDQRHPPHLRSRPVK
jgi:hypothetical protein